MQLPVLIEPVAGNGYRAHGPEPFAVTAEGSTPEEALQHLRDQMTTRLTGGVPSVSVDVPEGDHPLAEFAGDLKGDPLLEPWKQATAEYRRRMDEDPDVH